MDGCEALVFHPGNLEPQRPGTCDAAPRGCDAAAAAAGRMRALRHQTSQGPTKLTKLTTEDPKVTRNDHVGYMGMGQYLLIPFLMG